MARCLTPFYKINDETGVNEALPCGRCPNCKKRRVSNWSFRLLKESEGALTALFVTPTYNPENVPISKNGFMTLTKGQDSDMTKFLKRLRKISLTGIKIKYYYCGEYGSENMRPHYHMILFNALSVDVVAAWMKPNTNEPLGDIHFGTVEGASVGYTLKYISKNGKIPLHKRDDRIPEYSNMSKGMGLQYITENMKAWHLNGLRLYVVMEDGKKLSLPRYFRDKIFNKEQLEEAKNNISSKQDEYTPAYIESQFKKQSKDAKNRKL